MPPGPPRAVAGGVQPKRVVCPHNDDVLGGSADIDCRRCSASKHLATEPLPRAPAMWGVNPEPDGAVCPARPYRDLPYVGPLAVTAAAAGREVTRPPRDAQREPECSHHRALSVPRPNAGKSPGIHTAAGPPSSWPPAGLGMRWLIDERPTIHSCRSAPV